MDITYLGAGCVKLTGRGTSIVCDPYDESYGLGKLGAKADAVTLSSPDIKNPLAARIVIDGPGEYEVQGTFITGVPARLHTDKEGERGTIYVITLEDIHVVVTGNIAPGLNDRQTEAIGDTDVLVVPVGGHGLTLDAAAAAELVSRLEPKFVVPVHSDDGQSKYPMPQDPVDKFLKEMGSSPEPQGKLRVSGKDLPLETEVVLLERSSG